MTIGRLMLESFNWLIFVCKMEDEDEWTPYMTPHSQSYPIMSYNLAQ